MAGDVVYGINAVREALERGGIVNRVFVAAELRNRATRELMDLAKRLDVRFDIVPQAKLNQITGTHEHQGVAAAISPLRYVSLDECIAACGPKALVIVLDQIQHPKNVGLLIRTASGAGAATVVLSAHGGMLVDASVIRSSTGAVFRIPIVASIDIVQTLRDLKDAGFWVYGLDAKGRDSVFDVPWADRVVLVVGNESKGMRPTVRKVCDALVAIPLAGDQESLNAAIATGIAAFQVRYRHTAKN